MAHIASNVLAADKAKLSIAAGIIIGLAASFVQSLGLTIQRKSHVLNQALPESQQRVEHRRPLWLLGFVIFISSNILGSLFQIASLPVVILAPLGAVSLLWNAFFARLILGDVFSPFLIIGTLLIAGGAVLIAVFGIVPEPTHSLEDLLALFGRPAFVAYFSVLGAFVVVSLGIAHVVEYTHNRQRPIALPDSPPLTPNVGPLLHLSREENHTDATDRTPLLPTRRSRSPSPTPTTSTIVLSTPKPSPTAAWLGMAYASFSGILSGMCLIFAKSGVELLLLTLEGHNQFNRWETWILVLGLGVFALLQLWYLHKSLVLADPTLVCPLAFCFYNLSSIFNGLVYYDQFSLLSRKHLILVLTGIAILLAGVWIVSMPAQGGGGGVEIGTWREGDESLGADGEIRLETDVQAELGGQTHPPRITLSSVPGLSDWAHLAEQPSPIDGGDEDLERHPRVSSDSATHTVGTSRRRPPRLSPLESPHRSSLPPAHLRSPPLGTASLSGGFSIGLSPVSPGFAVLPRGRRRPSGVGVADLVQQVRTVEEGRRRVSEGDAVHSPVTSTPMELRLPRSGGGNTVQETARWRWKWLGRMFRQTAGVGK